MEKYTPCFDSSKPACKLNFVVFPWRGIVHSFSSLAEWIHGNVVSYLLLKLNPLAYVLINLARQTLSPGSSLGW